MFNINQKNIEYETDNTIAKKVMAICKSYN